MFLVLLDHPETIREPFGPEIPRIAINVRHAHALSSAASALRSAELNLRERGPVELLASDLRVVLAAFGEISGRIDNEQVLDALFASFCIGK